MGKVKAPLSRQLADIDLRLLRVFKAVVDANGFTVAQVTLNISPSAISNHMRDLETRLGMRLCTRGRTGFSVTEQGKVVYEATQELIEAMDQFRNRINNVQDDMLGDLHLAVAEQCLYIPGNGVVNALREFHETAPGVRLHVSNLAAEVIAPAVSEGTVNLGITVLHTPAPTLSLTPLFKERMKLYCGRGHQLFDAEENKATLQQLNNSEFIETQLMLSNQQRDPVMDTWKKQASASQQEARVALLLTGKFIGFIPEHLAQLELWSSDLRSLFSSHFAYENRFQLVVKPKTENNIIVSLFRSLMIKHSQLD